MERGQHRQEGAGRPSGRAGAPAAAVVILGILLALCPPARAVTARADPAGRLEDLHADWTRFIREVRVISVQGASVSPAGVYSGLVRPGGRDPRISGDAPVSGREARNDVIVYPSALDPRRAPGWLVLILDHEYFHARHLARDARVPLVDFGDTRANHSYYEATAWSYVLERAREGVYGELAAADLREINATYRRHLDLFREFVMETQPSAWLHYGRFLTSPD